MDEWGNEFINEQKDWLIRWFTERIASKVYLRHWESAGFIWLMTTYLTNNWFYTMTQVHPYIGAQNHLFKQNCKTDMHA